VLAGWQCVVMRPQAQAHALCVQIEKEKGTAVALPMIEIVPLTPISTPDFDKADYLIFVSANAVLSVPVSWWELISRSAARVVTMGQATSEAIKNRTPTFFTAPLGSTSETLLEASFLQATAISNKHVILLVGKTGRQFIAETLSKRGAYVERVEVYAQQCPAWALDPYFLQWRESKESIVFIATSAHCLENLMHLTPLAHQNWLHHQPVVVISERMKKQATERGFQVIWQAHGAHEAAIMKALHRC